MPCHGTKIRNSGKLNIGAHDQWMRNRLATQNVQVGNEVVLIQPADLRLASKDHSLN